MTGHELAALKPSDFYGSDLGSTLRHMLCNLMRVCRGSGRSYQVTRDLLEAAGTLRNYLAEHRQDMPAWEIESVLSVHRQRDPTLSFERQRQEDALDLILCGALQMVASRLSEDSTRSGLGREELDRGIRQLVGVEPTWL